VTRQFAQISTDVGKDPAFLSVSATARLLFYTVATQTDLSLVGVTAYTPGRWATRCAVDNHGDIDRALGELESAGLAAVDRATEEVALLRHLPNDSVINNMKMRRAAERQMAAIESPRLKERITSVRRIADPTASGSPILERQRLDVDVDVYADVDVDQSCGSNQRAQQSCAATSEETQDDDEVVVEQGNPDRADEALQILARRAVAGAKARGTSIGHPAEYTLKCLASQRQLNSGLARTLATEHPDWPPSRIANAIEPPETVVPPVYVPEGVGQGVGFGRNGADDDG
jgi:hypothetical protein